MKYTLLDHSPVTPFRSGAPTRQVQRASSASTVTVQTHKQTNIGRNLQLPQQNKLLFAFVELIFGVRPIWEAAKQKAREKIASRGQAIGVDLEAEVAALERAVRSWEEERQAIEDSSLQFPDYYTKAFHAYDKGNLCWEAAFQVPSAAKLVHAPVMDPDNKIMDPDGDDNLRRAYSAKLLGFMDQMGSSAPKDVVDVGCATGLSTLELKRIFPDTKLIGLDLSPHFLAVAKVLQRQRNTAENIDFRHAAGEATGIDSNAVDLVSICLVLHELPTRATQAIIEEAFRILRPGGTLAIMEMNPASDRFARIFGNPLAYVPFKATEPWLVEYVTTDLLKLIEVAGFRDILQEPSTPGHFTLAALKPASA